MKPRFPSVVPTLTLLFACGGGAPSPSATVMDSAGVAIVTNTAAQLGGVAEWSLAGGPSLTIATPEDGSFTLFRISGMAPLSSGRIAVANGSPQEILVFDSAGVLSQRFGQEGQGPGEFRRIGSIAPLPGDSIAVYDDGARRLSVFGPDGTLAHDASLAEAMTQAAASYADVHRLAGGDLVLFTGGDFNSDRTPHDGPFRAESESMRIRSDGSVAASYGRFPGTQVFVHIRGASGSPFFAAATDAATMGDNLIVGTEESTELRAYGPDGALTRIIRWPDRDRAVTQARLDEFLDTLMTLVPQAQRAGMRAMMAAIPHADEAPAYRTLVPSDDGHLWVGDYDPMVGMPDVLPPPRHWLVFSPDGTLTATIDTPTGFEPKFAQGARVLGTFTDSTGVESVRAYDLQEM